MGFISFFTERTVKASELKAGDVLLVGFMEWTILETDAKDGFVTVRCAGYSFFAGPNDKYRIRKK